MLFLNNDSNKVIQKYDTDMVNYNILNKHIESIKKITNKNLNIFIFTVPDKVEIYPEKLKRPFKKSFSDLIYNHLYTQLNSNKNTVVFNLKEFLLKIKTKTETELYWPLDSHYTYETTFCIFKVLISKINKNIEPQIERRHIFSDDEIISPADLLYNGDNFRQELFKIYNSVVYENKKEGVAMTNHDFNKWKLNFFKSKSGVNFLKRNNIYSTDLIKLIKSDLSKEYDLRHINLRNTALEPTSCFEKLYSFGGIINTSFYEHDISDTIRDFKHYCSQLFIYTKLKINKSVYIDKKLLLIGDSYSSMGLIHMFSLYFREFYFVFSSYIDGDFINKVNPDIFIFEKASRFI